MAIKFDELLDDEEAAVIDPRDIFFTLNRDKKFAFPRDIQTEVMKAWFGQRDSTDTVVKLNVGSGKTLVGLLLLQSSLNEGIRPAIYIAPDKQLVDQVLAEAKALGIDAVDDPRDTAVQSGEKIAVTTVHRLFNGKSIFGVGSEGVKLKIGAIVIDDVHACIATINEQFRIQLPNTHKAYHAIFNVAKSDLQRQSPARFLDLKNGDSQAIMEIPYWTWLDHQQDILESLHAHKSDDQLLFSYPLLSGILPQCRCIMSGQKLEIEPFCPPTDLVMAFSKAKRRIYMTGMLADDSALITHFGANPKKLSNPIVPVSSQSMGERMILMPQELNADFEAGDIRKLLVSLAKKENVVVIVPSKPAADLWQQDADQILIADNVVDGIAKLRQKHVGVTVLVNRYDGIDLPHDACRVLTIVGLPEVTAYTELTDMSVLSDSQSGLRRQMQRIEQGMGRGVRSNDDYCVVLLVGARLTARVKSPEGAALLTPATQAQVDLSRKVAKQLSDVDLKGLKEVIDQCLSRDSDWVKVSKRALLKARAQPGLAIDPKSVAMRAAFDLSRVGDHKAAVEVLRAAVNAAADNDEKAWLLQKCAAIEHHISPSESQKMLLAAYKLNPNVLRPMEGVAYQKVSAHAGAQAAAVQKFHQSRFLEAADRLLYANQVLDELVFHKVPADRFEAALDSVAEFIGIKSQRPEKLFGEGPDNLWALPAGSFLVIECKSNAASEKGISKTDLGQLDQAMSWFDAKYPAATAVPVIVHPLRMLGDGATAVSGMRVMTEEELKKLRKAVEAFGKALSDPDTLNNVKKVNELVNAQGFGAEFLARYTKAPQ
jgi:Helicase C-terminal domain/DEAD/DEAH box helicase